MTVVSNDPSYLSFISLTIFSSYWIAPGVVVVVYDWVLTLGQEVELIWRQRWSLMTVLYLVIRYIGISVGVIGFLGNMPFVSLTDAECTIINYTTNGINVLITVALGVIMITRLYAMYQRSRIILIFLVVIFLAINMACGTMAAIGLKYTVGEELILFGIYVCNYQYQYNQFLLSVTWILYTVWEVLALCFSVWIVVKHFRDLRRHDRSTGSTTGDCFRVLIQSHVLYFSCFVVVSCFQLVVLSPEILNSNSIGASILSSTLQFSLGVQMFIMGPHLILSVREYHANLVADSDAEASMNPIVFQERVHVSTSSTV